MQSAMPSVPRRKRQLRSASARGSLHSTGQLHKGGPNTAVCLQITAEISGDVSIPGSPYSFGTFIRAQAIGDVRSLQGHGRRVVRVHLGADYAQGLTALTQALADL